MRFQTVAANIAHAIARAEKSVCPSRRDQQSFPAVSLQEDMSGPEYVEIGGHRFEYETGGRSRPRLFKTQPVAAINATNRHRSSLPGRYE
jgi:hypothetical protein